MSSKKENKTRATGMKLLNDVEKNKSISIASQVNLSLSKQQESGNKSKQIDHYVLQTIKGESTIEGDLGETIDFILRDETNESTSTELPLPRARGEITSVSLEVQEEEGDDPEAKPEEILEHVCGKCNKTFRCYKGLEKHLDFCRFDSGYHLRKAEMMKNLEKIEKDAVIMEKKDICSCCGESYDSSQLGRIICHCYHIYKHRCFTIRKIDCHKIDVSLSMLHL